MNSILLPLGVYLAITLGVPLANGGAERSGFWRHVAEVLCVAALLAVARGLVELRRFSPLRLTAHE